MDKSYLSLLPKDLEQIYSQHLSTNELQQIAESDPALANIVDLWGRKA